MGFELLPIVRFVRWLTLTGWLGLNCCVVPAQDVMVGTQVPTSRMIGLDKIEHEPFDRLLRKYVDQNGLVDYRAWKSDAADVQALRQYLEHLSQANLKGNRQQTLAFWINAYNALTIHGILREYPTTTIRNHTAVLFGYNIWKNLKLRVNQQAFSLDDIEHQVLRKMNEPRIHFAIVCASKGCPRLLAEAYEADSLEKQLELNTRDFFRREQNFRYDVGADTFYLSAILDWFGTDFGVNQAEQLKAIAQWLPTESAREHANRGRVVVRYLEYDWDLNEQRSSSK